MFTVGAVEARREPTTPEHGLGGLLKAKRSDTGHRFGGEWTELKLAHVHYYLQCYVNALSKVGFDLWYVDPFAGSGTREASTEIGGIFDGRPIETIVEVRDGSAAIALKMEPQFQHLILNDDDPRQVADLQTMCGSDRRDIRVTKGDGNEALLNLIRMPPWNSGKQHGSRGVVFLDPYAMSVNFSTLVELAGTKALDVWYLFPFEAIVRQLAVKYSGVGPKEGRLDLILGPNWRELYDMPQPSPAPKLDLLDEAAPEELQRRATAQQVQDWFRAELAKHFPYVPEPIGLYRSANRQMFSLFLCVSNPSNKAIELADDFMKYVRLGRLPASHQK